MPDTKGDPLIEALRKRLNKVAFATVRHEGSSAFMAPAFAKHSGRLGACIATTGPGAVHLMNGPYDAKLDNIPVVAVTGSTFHDLEGMHFVQSVETTQPTTDVALFNERVNSAGHTALVANLACRAALAGRGVAHPPSPRIRRRQHSARTSRRWRTMAAGAPRPGHRRRARRSPINSVWPPTS